ncbi:MAG: GTP cyclohydrolase, FolE2/MptA family [Fervidicoccaceae archaeon]
MSSKSVPDVHSESPEHPVALNLVGLSRYPVLLRFESSRGSCSESPGLAEAHVDLPAHVRGLHASRTSRALREVLYEKGDCRRLEEQALLAAERLLDLHEYSSRALVRLRSRLIIGDQAIDVSGGAIVDRRGERVVSLGVSFEGLTSCPSAREIFAYFEGLDRNKAPTHTQRARLTVDLEFVDGLLAITPVELYEMLARVFVKLPAGSLSRVEEYEVVKSLVERALFAEDVARRAAKIIEEGFAGSRRGRAHIVVRAEESVHSYDLLASTLVQF